jgi:hypothetical protein
MRRQNFQHCTLASLQKTLNPNLSNSIFRHSKQSWSSPKLGSSFLPPQHCDLNSKLWISRQTIKHRFKITRISHLKFDVVAAPFSQTHALFFFPALNILCQTLKRHEICASAASKQLELRPTSPAQVRSCKRYENPNRNKPGNIHARAKHPKFLIRFTRKKTAW